MNRPSPAVVVGLALALGSPALLAVTDDLIPGGHGAAANLTAQLVMWVLLGAVVVIVLRFERQPISSLGVRTVSSRSLIWGLIAAAALMYGVIPIAMALLSFTGLPAFEEGLSRVLALPLWLRIGAVATGGVVEEVLYRGYAITRLEALTGSRVFAAAVSVLIFALAHWPLWGPGPVVTFFVSGAFLAAWFLWRRDLLANIVAHIVVDSFGLVFAPPSS